jgi:putative ABC transport system permease protein
MSGLSRFTRWLLWGELRAHPLRALLAVAAIAVGVAMGFAIHLINAAAFNEFTAAVRTLSGQADIEVSGREPWFDEAIYPELASLPDVAEASPLLRIQAGIPGQRATLEVIGVDALRAVAVTPAVIGMASTERRLDLLSDDGIFLSAAASSWLQRQPGQTLALRLGTRDLAVRVAGTLPQARAGQRLAAMDIAAAQWHFGKTGLLSRIDLKLHEGVSRSAFRQQLAERLERAYPGRFLVTEPDDGSSETRSRNMSRAYRVNLTVLALVALTTGAFLVFSTQALSVLRRRSQFALLRVLGTERRQLVRQILLEGAGLGSIGALLGLATGYTIAALALRYFGGDLGAGYFAGVRPAVAFAPGAALVFFGLGLGVALLGCLGPALEAARAAPAVALKAGGEELALAPLSRAWPALACLLLAALLSQAPPVFELPVFGYLSVGLMLIGGISLMPRLAALLFTRISRMAERLRAAAVVQLAAARLANASGQAALAMGGVLSSFSLMVAMAIMVASFRISVDQWLVQLLPADLYVRVQAGSAAGGFSDAEQQQLASLPGVARIEFVRVRQLTLAPDRPAVHVLARALDPANPGQKMQLVGGSLPVPAGVRPVWVSEAMQDLYGVRPGAFLDLPLGGRLQRFFVAGVWRDYSSQFGALQVRLEDYRALTGDMTINDVGIWATPGASAGQVEARVRGLPFGAQLEFAQPGDIRAASLAIFDRSFAVTYLLEAIAIGIGLTGVAASFSAQTLARAREFGMLRHVGLTRGQVLSVLALEGGALTGLGVLCGFLLGWLISLVLVFVVNPQSFHWSMELHMPWDLLAGVATVLLVAAVLTALVSGRHALSGGPLRAVREDW